MKINKIYISAFGGLKDFTLDLKDGLNVVYGNNEDGKSTVAAFIKAMFFGTGKKTQNLSESIRQKYTPWDGSPMAGRIYFEHDKKDYCLEREFRKSDSTDRILLTDTTLGKQINTSDNVGNMFFGMSAATFERSLFIDAGGNFSKDSVAAGEINAKLSNIALTGTEDVSYQKIEKVLSDAKNKIISKTGRAGSFAEDLRMYDSLNERLKNADFDARKKAELTDKLSKSRAEYEGLYAEYSRLKTLTEYENDIKNAEKLKKYLDTKDELDSLNSTLKLSDGTTLDETFIKKVNFGINKCEKTKYKCDEIQNDIDRLDQTIKLQNQNSPESAKRRIDELNKKIKSINAQKDELAKKEKNLNFSIDDAKQKLDAKKTGKKSVFITLLITAAVFSAIAAGAFVLKYATVGTVSCALCLILFLLALIFNINSKNALYAVQNKHTKLCEESAEIKSVENSLQEEINSITAEINSLSALLNTDFAMREQRQAELDAKTQALNTEKQKLQAELDDVFGFFSRYKTVNSTEQINELLADLESKTEKQKQLKLSLKYLSDDLSNISYEQAKEKLLKLQDNNHDKNVDIKKVKADLEMLTDKLNSLKDDITAAATELKTSFKNSENPEDIKRMITECKERMVSKKNFCESVDTALSVLEESFYELRKGYGSELEKLTQNIFSCLTDGKYKNVNVTDTLDISVENKNVFGMRESGYLSLGTTHQAYLSLRLAIAELISQNGNMLPVFLDDSLSQYDDKRTENAMKFLLEYCKNGQGILFTCHNAVCNVASQLGIEIQRPYN